MSELQLIRPLYKQESVMKELFIASLQTAMSFLLEYLPNTISYVQNCILQRVVFVHIVYDTYFPILDLFNINNILYQQVQVLVYFSNTELAEETGHFNRCMILAVYLNSIFVNTKVFLNGQNIYKYQFYTQLVTCILFRGISYFLLQNQELGIVGCALILTSLDLLNNIILFSLIFITKCTKETLFKFKRQYLQNTFNFFKRSYSYRFYIMVRMYYLQKSTISAHVLMSNFAVFLYSFSYKYQQHQQHLQVMKWEEKKVEIAKKYTQATFVIDGIFLLITLGFFTIFGNTLINYLSEDQLVVEEIQTSMYLLVAFIILDGLQAIISGLVRVIGRELALQLHLYYAIWLWKKLLDITFVLLLIWDLREFGFVQQQEHQLMISCNL